MINRFRNSVLLAAIGDALGWITEFEKTEISLQRKYGISNVNSYIDWEKNVGGRFNGYIDRIKAGAYSDDTQLLLAVARSINGDGHIDNVYFSKTELPAWLDYARGAGRTVKNAARKIERKSALWNNNFFTYRTGKTTLDYKESGANGAAMRILPIALSNITKFDRIKEDIFTNSIVTHGHPRAIVGAILYGLSIDTMIQQDANQFSYDSYLTEIGRDFEKKLTLDCQYKPDIKGWINKWNKDKPIDFSTSYKTTVVEGLEALRLVFRSLRDNRKPLDVLTDLGCFAPSTQGSGISTVVAGIYLASKHHADPQEAILTATNSFGSDTDSIAAFTGGLIGSLYDIDIIPNEWKSVQDSAYLTLIAERLYSISKNEKVKDNRPLLNNSIKCLNRISIDHFFENEFVYFHPLGRGRIIAIERQKALTGGKYNLILDVEFELGQTCKFSKLLDITSDDHDIASMLV